MCAVQASKFEYDRIREFVILWLERGLELQCESHRKRLNTNRHGTCLGTYDIYDCANLKLSQIKHIPSLRLLGKAFALGQEHFPESLHRCYVINAPFMLRTAWAFLKPVLQARTIEKVVFDKGVPDELVDVLGDKSVPTRWQPDDRAS